ncbi:MAG: hypothetical protein KC502_09505 [Myxococcales bacterium]|nr:hypothetical protein [Myxococcales bacterium]
MSSTVLRLRVGHRVPGRAHGTHEVEYRALLFHNGREVIRYSLYEDPDSRHGFTGRQSGSTYGLTLSEHFIVDSTAEAPAEIHIRYEGYVTVAGVGRTRFRGTLIILGTGKIRPGRPAFDDSEGRATFTAGSVTVGLW